MNFLETLQKQVIVLDGAMGTQIQALKLDDADFGGTPYRMLSDILVLSHPELVRDIHLSYYRAGANAAETNTFGATPMRLSEYDFTTLDLSRFAPAPDGADLRALSYEDFAYVLNRRAVELAADARAEYRKEAAYDGRPLFIGGSIGPSNRVVSSTDANLTRVTFDAAAENFYHQARGLVDAGADFLLFETQQDVLELKAGIIGAKRAMREAGRKVPVICQVSVDAFSKMQIFNTDIHAAQVTVGGMGIAAFGINCSIGPDLMARTVEKLARYSPLPISVVPNAGLPESENGKTVFKFPPDKMAEHLKRYVEEFGVNIVGGCCGTTPEHIAAIAEAVGGRAPALRAPERKTYISGPQQAVVLDSKDALIMIGERLNVRGSKKVRDSVESGDGIDHDALEDVVHNQIHELGLNVIDVCMDSNVVDTTQALKEVIHRQSTDFTGAMSIDSFAVDALVEAVKVYPGRPIINSISLEEVSPGVTKIDAVVPATIAHDPVYIGLCTGPEGPAATREDKAALAKQIVGKAGEYGVRPDQLLIDMNVFPVGAESVEGMNFALESLEAIPLIKAHHPDLRTVCGVGNLTNGLASKPYMRQVLTSIWLDEARKRGLDAAIVNPNHYVYVGDLEREHYELGLRTIMQRDMDAFADLEIVAEQKKGVNVVRRSSYDDLPLEEAICEKIKDGFKQREHGHVELAGHQYRYADKIVEQAAGIVCRHEPLEFINRYLMRAMNELGDGFARGEVSLPHLLKSADVMKQVMGFLEEYMRVTAGLDVHAEIDYKGIVVIGTVYQDVHSIGKDLAKTLFENYGYRVIDTGVMTPLQTYLDLAKEHDADAIGMSALLVQTSNHMIAVAQMMNEQGLRELPVLIGGAPVNERHAGYVAMAGTQDVEAIRDNVFYCATAMDGVNVMNTLMAAKERAPFLERNRGRLQKAYEKATQKAQENEELLRTLPRRSISFDSHITLDTPWCAYETVSMDLQAFRDHIDLKTLFALNWKFGGTALRERQGETPEKLRALFDDWVSHAAHEGWIRPMGVYGVFPCQSDGNEVVVYDSETRTEELCRFGFTLVVGAGRKDTVCAAQYFWPRESGRFDAIGVQVTTSGPQVDAQIRRFREEGDSESVLYLQGLSDRVAEDMADYLHALCRKRVGAETKQGTRWSPGYPAMADPAYNHTIHELLHAGDLIGVRITEAGEFSPTGTTAAVVSFHPDARYT